MLGRDRSGSTKRNQWLSKVDQQTGSTILKAYISRVFCISSMSITFHNPEMNKCLDTFLRLLHYLPVEFTLCHQEVAYSVPCLILLLRLLHFNLPPEGWQCQNFKLMKDYKFFLKHLFVQKHVTVYDFFKKRKVLMRRLTRDCYLIIFTVFEIYLLNLLLLAIISLEKVVSTW